MKFHTANHRHYCGIDLHARSLYVCILNDKGKILLHMNIKASPVGLARAVRPFQDDIVIGVECMFSWYWGANWCEDHNVAFVLGHAL